MHIAGSRVKRVAVLVRVADVAGLPGVDACDLIHAHKAAARDVPEERRVRSGVQQRAEDVLDVEGVRQDAVRGRAGGGGDVGEHDVRPAGAYATTADADEKDGGEEREERGEDEEALRRGRVRPEER